MNNTIHSNSNTKLSFHENTNEVDFLKIWQKKKTLLLDLEKQFKFYFSEHKLISNTYSI